MSLSSRLFQTSAQGIEQKNSDEHDFGVSYIETKLSELEINETTSASGKKTFTLEMGEKSVPVSSRFFSSLGSKSGVKSAFFDLFSPAEIIEKVVKKNGDMDIVVTLDGTAALGVFRTGEPMISIKDAIASMSGFEPLEISYSQGEIRALFVPGKTTKETVISDENYAKQFGVSVPVDGFGQPQLVPVLVRVLCMNQLAPAGNEFSSPIVVGKEDGGHTIARALKAYSGDKNFATLAEKLDQNRTAFASVAEIHRLDKSLASLKSLPSPRALEISKTIWGMVGREARDVFYKNHVENPKMLRRIASGLTRYELLQMLTEIRTHEIQSELEKRGFDSLAHDFLKRDPDLEHTAEKIKSKAVNSFFSKRTKSPNLFLALRSCNRNL
jgi:hypothetical protein